MADALRAMGAEPNLVGNFRELSRAELRDETNAGIPRSAFVILPHVLNKDWLLLSTASNAEFLIWGSSGSSGKQHESRR